VSRYRFEYTNTTDGSIVVVELPDTDTNSPDIETVIGSFVQFLRGVTFGDKNIAKFIKHDLVSG